MNKPESPAKISTQIYEEASDWIIQHRDGELDTPGKHAFDAWLRRSPEHVRAYFEMSATWEDVSSLDPKRNPSADDLIARARTGDNIVPFDAGGPSQIPILSQAPDAIQAACKARGSSRRNLLAASIAIAILGAGMFSWLNHDPGYSTGIGEQHSITLTDGSTIDLNARTRIKIRFSEHERGIDLIEGQALFHVAKDKTRPFVVSSAGTAIRAVGTEFDVYQRKSGTTVTVLEGRVSVLDAASLAEPAPIDNRRGSTSQGSAPSQPGISSLAPARPAGSAQIVNEGRAVLVSAGQQVTATPRVIAQPAPANIAAATAWIQHRLVFDSAPLSEVAEEFNRYDTRQLVIRDVSLRDIHISGSFSSLDPTLFLQFLRAQSEISVEETDKEIRISKK
jgi:transmembrane sensor